MVLLIGLAAFFSTLLGGWFALKQKDKLHLILGFSAGAVIGVAFFDLLPEALTLSHGYEVSTITTLIVIGFALFMLLDRLLILHGHSDEDCDNEQHSGTHGASALSLHSFLDGLAIGLAFKVSAAVGLVVAVAVLVHDFSDGINTVSFIVKHGGSSKTAFRWLLLDAVTPMLGILSTFLFTVSETTLGLLLAIFCGFFIYIGASDLLPESHHKHANFMTTLMTILGIATLYIAIRLASF